MDDINFDEEPADLDFGPSAADLNTQQKKEVRRSWQNVTKKRGDIQAEYKRLEKLGIDPGYLDLEIEQQTPVQKATQRNPLDEARKDLPKAQAVARGAVQGASMEFADDAISGVRSLLPGGKSWSEEHAAEQKRLAESRKQPGYTGGNIIGSLIGAPGLAAARVASAAGRTASPMAAAAARAARSARTRPGRMTLRRRERGAAAARRAARCCRTRPPCVRRPQCRNPRRGPSSFAPKRDRNACRR